MKSPTLISESVLYKGKFRQLSLMTYKTDKNNEISIEKVESTNNVKQYPQFPSGVGIIAITKKTRNILLIENFRYPINKKCLEFPAGTIDEIEIIRNPNKSPVEVVIDACKRELKEETGYNGEFCTFLSMNNQFELFTYIYSDPWKSKDSTAIALFSIDIESQKEHKQELENTEIIKTHFVQLDQLMPFIIDKAINEDYAIRAELYSIACGINYNKIFNN